MPLTDVLEKLYTRRRFGIQPGVDRVSTLLGRLGNPEQSFRTIHVVGTNGKGSTSAFLSSILTHSGHRVAQFSSPHLVRFTERFKINGQEYPAEKLANLLETVLNEAPEEATFFEIITALAALVFSRENVGLAIMEAGMGGRSDATAAFPGEMTLITPISLDHTDYLGATLEEIAREKIGIIRSGTTVISATQPDEVTRILDDACTENGCLLKYFGRDFSAVWNADATVEYVGMSQTLRPLSPGIAGRYQLANASVALAAAEQLDAAGTNISTSAFAEGIAAAYWPGRMELVPGTPRLLLDGAHNPAGAAALAEALADYSYGQLVLVTGICDDKDIDLIYAPLIPLIDTIYTVTPAVERGLSDEKLSRFFQTRGIASRPCGSVTSGIRTAVNEATDTDLVLVCGSLFVVGEVKAWLDQVHFTGIRG
ncbi:MAG: bifunctional folylpolyglutamate synthase/dihydrofolate synthase [Desulfuromonadaceae bacterium]|nr:bifunctional folylpolyglutamate synthase/dihydrofolate synthase [Desulfuromonadaceae bacterium]MDD5106343.1 bifunctional folylpolyglutamate synthase/dihydrofolate synthase [Desulfuromonadaceae bacterium]